jgi:serine O-acetyltransferase
VAADSTDQPGLWQELQEAYETYRRHSFKGGLPLGPPLKRFQARVERWMLVYVGMPLPAILLYRIRNRLLRWGIPLLPYLCDLINSGVWHIAIGRHATIGPGFVIPHGFVVIDGVTKIGKNCSISPWVTIGLAGRRKTGFDQRGPIVGDRVYIGTGAKVLGMITVGDDVRIGANSVVIDDVPSGATVVGAPARVVHTSPPVWVNLTPEEAQKAREFAEEARRQAAEQETRQ